MNELLVITLLVVSIFAAGLRRRVGLTLAGTAWIGMEIFSSRPAGDAMAVTIWGAASSWTLTALPLFLWMGEILFRTRLSEDLFKGLAPWLNWLPGRLLHTNVIGCAIFAAVWLVGGHLRHRRQDDHPRTDAPRLSGIQDPGHAVGRRHAGPPDPAVDHHDRLRRGGGCLHRRSSPASCRASCSRCYSGYIAWWAIRNPGEVPAADPGLTFREKLSRSRHLIPVMLLIGAVLGSIYTGIATATRRRPWAWWAR